MYKQGFLQCTPTHFPLCLTRASTSENTLAGDTELQAHKPPPPHPRRPALLPCRALTGVPPGLSRVGGPSTQSCRLSPQVPPLSGDRIALLSIKAPLGNPSHGETRVAVCETRSHTHLRTRCKYLPAPPPAYTRPTAPGVRRWGGGCHGSLLPPSLSVLGRSVQLTPPCRMGL